MSTDTLTVEQRQIVNKRLSLNLLIQGAATHAHWTAHHLVRDKLAKIEPKLPAIYDEVMLRTRLGYWIGGLPSIMGDPIGFWWQLEDTDHEFRHHPFLSAHGLEIAVDTQEDAFRRCQQAKMEIDAYENDMRGVALYYETIGREEPHKQTLADVAKDVCCESWGIGRELLEGKLTQTPRFGTIREPETLEGQMILDCMVGWSAVVRRQGILKVKAAAAFWPLLVHELIKGTVELICLHGMNEVSDRDYEIALERTDHIEFEIPMLQIGGTIFKQLLKARPKEIPLAECLMHISKLAPPRLESFMFQLFESPNRATDIVRNAAGS